MKLFWELMSYDQGCQGRVFKVMKNDHFLNIFRRLGPFPQFYEQVKEWFILELHEMIRVLHVVVFPIDFNLLWNRGTS